MNDDEWVCRRNIERFRRQLADPDADHMRETILDLLRQHENRLAHLLSQRMKSSPPARE